MLAPDVVGGKSRNQGAELGLLLPRSAWVVEGGGIATGEMRRPHQSDGQCAADRRPAPTSERRRTGRSVFGPVLALPQQQGNGAAIPKLTGAAMSGSNDVGGTGCFVDGGSSGR